MGNFFFCISLPGWWWWGSCAETVPHHDPETPCVERRTTQKSCLAGGVWSLGQFCPCVPKLWTASMPWLGQILLDPLIDLFIHLIVVARNNLV